MFSQLQQLRHSKCWVRCDLPRKLVTDPASYTRNDCQKAADYIVCIIIFSQSYFVGNPTNLYHRFYNDMKHSAKQHVQNV